MGKIIRNGVLFGGSTASGSDIEVLTQEAYDSLVAAGMVDDNKYYFITDDNTVQIVVDTEVNSTSTNPVQNKAIKAYVDSAIETAINSAIAASY